MIDRYSRQIPLPGIGTEGQRKLDGSYVVVVGCGALGTAISNSLARAGVGKLRVIDRDFIEYHNLQRQVLFDEEDIENQLPKAVAAERHLKKINSSIHVEGIVSDINPTTIERLVQGSDLILDGLDNLETRYLLNDVALKHKIPWIYGAAIATSGMIMTLIPGRTPCFRCIFPEMPDPDMILTCDTGGILNTVPLIVGSLQATQAIKLLVGDPDISEDLTFIDVWQGLFRQLKTVKGPEGSCPSCRGDYEFLDRRLGTRTNLLCGQNAVQIINPEVNHVSLSNLASRLEPLGKVTLNEFMLRFIVDEFELFIFPDGRAIVKNTNDESLARGLYAKYVGS
ncbi:MAG: ThiF family adenylyltransferase [Chloroflexota bacterium]|nr:ThiF family adenylyltransferase [Chloroflexota bacterium]